MSGVLPAARNRHLCLKYSKSVYLYYLVQLVQDLLSPLPNKYLCKVIYLSTRWLMWAQASQPSKLGWAQNHETRTNS
jgi:hypothetical protein